MRAGNAGGLPLRDPGARSHARSNDCWDTIIDSGSLAAIHELENFHDSPQAVGNAAQVLPGCVPHVLREAEDSCRPFML